MWEGREESGMEEMTSVTSTVVAPCALDTCQSSLHVLVTVCAVRGCLYADLPKV